MFMPHVCIEKLCSVTRHSLSLHQRTSRTARFTAQGKSCRYRDPSLLSPEGILPHRCIYRENMGSPPNAVCREQGFRTDNLLLPLLSGAQPWAEVTMRPPVGV